MIEALKKLDKDTEDSEREILRGLLLQCTESQQRKFHHIFPLGVDGMPRDKIVDAADICERTIKANNKTIADYGNDDSNASHEHYNCGDN